MAWGWLSLGPDSAGPVRSCPVNKGQESAADSQAQVSVHRLQKKRPPLYDGLFSKGMNEEWMVGWDQEKLNGRYRERKL